MVAVVRKPAQKVILSGVSWDTYERLLTEHNEDNGTHFFFNNGELEIMVLSYEHEHLSHSLTLFIRFIASEMEIDIEGAGSTTFQRKDLAKGFEPDACFYIRNPERIRGKKRLDLRQDPPPDLVIEVDITSPSLDKLPIYAAIGVLEIWHYDGTNFILYRLRGNKYTKAKESILLPGASGKVIVHFIEESQKLTRPVWLRQVRQWAKQQFKKRK